MSASTSVVQAPCPECTEREQRPRRRFELVISIAGDTWSEVLGVLDDLERRRTFDALPPPGNSGRSVGGGGSVGWIVRTSHNPEQTHERYHQQVALWLEREREREARQ